MRRIIFLRLLLILLLSPFSTWAADQTWHQGTVQTWVTNSTDVTNNSLILGSSVTISNAGYMLADCEIFVNSFSGAVTAGTAITVWLLRIADSTNYEDGGSAVTPARLPDITFPLRAVSTAQRVIRSDVRVPAGLFKPLIRNDGTGVSMQGSTGGVPWTLKCLTYTPQQ